MNIFIVYWHPEPRSFNGALLRTAVETLVGSGHSVKTSDLHAMRFDPVSGRHNFKLRYGLRESNTGNESHVK